MKQQINNINETINLIFDTELNSVKQSFPSIYTREDVQFLLVKMHKAINDYMISVEQEAEQLQQDKLSESDKMYTQEQISDALHSMNTSRIVEIDYDDAEFELNYNNTIELTHVNHNIDMEEFEANLLQALDNLK